MGSQKYEYKMKELAKRLKKLDYEVIMPAFDHYADLDAYGVCSYNRKVVKEADFIYFYWDQRSLGALFDFGMIFYSGKPFKLMHLERKVFADVMLGQEKLFTYYCWPI